MGRRTFDETHIRGRIRATSQERSYDQLPCNHRLRSLGDVELTSRLNREDEERDEVTHLTTRNESRREPSVYSRALAAPVVISISEWELGRFEVDLGYSTVLTATTTAIKK